MFARILQLRTVGLCAAIATALVMTLLSAGLQRSAAELVRDGRRDLARGRTKTALAVARRATEAAPQSISAWRLRVDAAEAASCPAEAVSACQRLAILDTSAAGQHWLRIGAWEMQRFRIGSAEDALRRALAIDPRDVAALRLSAQLAGVVGRCRDLNKCLVGLIQSRSFTLDDLIILGTDKAFINDDDLVDSILSHDQSPSSALLNRARAAQNDNQTERAEMLLSRLVAADPYFWEAQSLLGVILSASPGDAFLRWNADLPSGADSDAGIWLARGLWLQSRGDWRQAGRCFWESLSREPESLTATVQLGQTLLRAGESALGNEFLERGRLLESISALVTQTRERGDLSLTRDLTNALEQVGRLWEAWAWCSLGQAAEWHGPEGATRLQLLAAQLAPSLPRTRPSALPGRNHDWGRFALPDWSQLRPDAGLSATPARLAEINFVDESRQAGLAFTYVNGENAATGGRRIFETLGGGVAALDFDGDGWTDLYFPQGNAGPVVRGTGPHDALFRNFQGARFDQVTDASGIVEGGFSHGVAAGDFDNDGFPDLYVANIGCNRLFHNHGDGTFADVTEAAGIGDNAWTVSCAIADLNGDGLPDLFDVNYLTGSGIFTAICTDERGSPRVCRPTVFEPACDRVALNLGDGTFAPSQGEAGLDLPRGMGLGLVIADFTGDDRLDVFVANDQAPNYLLVCDQPGAGRILKFHDEGHLRGLAVDHSGQARASMGVAAGDINQDGRVDLFVTNFSQESDVLYLSQSDGSYTDSTAEAGLRAATFNLLGFGTQLFDVDLDGLLDLVSLNGHIDNFTSAPDGHRMRAQFFRGLPGARFAELLEDRGGSFFPVKRLGRGLATLDWNRDGLLDFVATDLEAPVALATNRSQRAGHGLHLKLVGTTGSRDAIGARLRIVREDGRRFSRCVTAGDGYESCNDRLVHIGVGDTDRVACLEIDWPSGRSSKFEDVPCDIVWIIVEGAPRLTSLQAANE
jgi:tetratricopeptide (TPR) repeat protein